MHSPTNTALLRFIRCVRILLTGTCTRTLYSTVTVFIGNRTDREASRTRLGGHSVAPLAAARLAPFLWLHHVAAHSGPLYARRRRCAQSCVRPEREQQASGHVAALGLVERIRRRRSDSDHCERRGAFDARERRRRRRSRR